MFKDTTDQLIGILSGIIALAALGVVLSKNSNTTSIIGATTTGLGQILGTAIAPATGQAVPVVNVSNGTTVGGISPNYSSSSGGGGGGVNWSSVASTVATVAEFF